MKGAMYVAIQRKDWSSWASCGTWMARIASTFSWLGCTPSASNNIPKNVIISSLISLAQLARGCANWHHVLPQTMNCNVVSNTNCSWAFLKDKIHLLLENIMTNTGSKGKANKSKSAKRAMKGEKVRRFFIKDYRAITMTGIQF